MNFFTQFWKEIIATFLSIASAGFIIKKLLIFKKNISKTENKENIINTPKTSVEKSPRATAISFNNSNNNTINLLQKPNPCGDGNIKNSSERKTANIFFEFPVFSLDEIKKKVSILMIDDDKEDLVSLKDYLKKEWKVYSITDLDNYKNTLLEKSQIICIDIHGVGITLGLDNGVKLLEGIAQRYPNKKLILYSAVSSFDNMFEKALRFADESVSKSDFTDFSSAIEHSAQELFSGKRCILFLYNKYQKLKIIPEGMSIDMFSTVIYSAIDKRRRIDINKIMSGLNITYESAAHIVQAIQQCIGK